MLCPTVSWSDSSDSSWLLTVIGQDALCNGWRREGNSSSPLLLVAESRVIFVAAFQDPLLSDRSEHLLEIFESIATPIDDNCHKQMNHSHPSSTHQCLFRVWHLLHLEVAIDSGRLIGGGSKKAEKWACCFFWSRVRFWFKQKASHPVHGAAWIQVKPYSFKCYSSKITYSEQNAWSVCLHRSN